MAETTMHAGPRMQQLLAAAAAAAGTTPEQMVNRLAAGLRDDMCAAVLIFEQVEPEEPVSGDVCVALDAILARSRRTALDLLEVLDDADRAERPLRLRMASEARNG